MCFSKIEIFWSASRSKYTKIQNYIIATHAASNVTKVAIGLIQKTAKKRKFEKANDNLHSIYGGM